MRLRHGATSSDARPARAPRDRGVSQSSTAGAAGGVAVGAAVLEVGAARPLERAGCWRVLTVMGDVADGVVRRWGAPEAEARVYRSAGGADWLTAARASGRLGRPRSAVRSTGRRRRRRKDVIALCTGDMREVRPRVVARAAREPGRASWPVSVEHCVAASAVTTRRSCRPVAGRLDGHQQARGACRASCLEPQRCVPASTVPSSCPEPTTVVPRSHVDAERSTARLRWSVRSDTAARPLLSVEPVVASDSTAGPSARVGAGHVLIEQACWSVGGRQRPRARRASCSGSGEGTGCPASCRGGQSSAGRHPRDAANADADGRPGRRETVCARGPATCTLGATSRRRLRPAAFRRHDRAAAALGWRRRSRPSEGCRNQSARAVVPRRAAARSGVSYVAIGGSGSARSRRRTVTRRLPSA